MGFSVIDAQGRLKQFTVPTEVTITTTGNIDNLDFSNADTIRMNNASLSTIRGLKAGTAGQRVVIVSVGAGQVDLAHQNTNSTAANRLINKVSSLVTSLSPGSGSTLFEYDGTTARWRLVSHVQGAAITITGQTYSGNNSMTWTSVAATTYEYILDGARVTVWFQLDGTSGGVASTKLSVSTPWTVAQGLENLCFANNVGTLGFSLMVAGTPAGSPDNTSLTFLTSTEGSWSLGAVGVQGQMSLPIT